MKVGIFDPLLKDKGHHLQFNLHVAKLFSFDINTIVFLDIGETLKNNMAKFKTQVKDIKIDCVNISSEPCPSNQINKGAGEISNKYLLFGRRVKWYKNIFKRIESLNLDFVVFTSEGSPAMFISTPKFKYMTIVHFSLNLKKNKKSLLQIVLMSLSNRLLKRFLAKAQKIFALEPFLVDEIRECGFENVDYMPCKCFVGANSASESVIQRNDAHFSLLTIGGIYEGKGIEFVLEAYDRHKLNIPYKIVGFPIGEYGEFIIKKARETKAKGCPIETRFEYVTNDEFVGLIQKADFIVLPYDEMASSGYFGASQLFYDSIEQSTPIIAPAIEPFKAHFRNYEIGIMYKPGDATSFVDAIRRAEKTGKSVFRNNLEHFRREYAYDLWKNKMKTMLEKGKCYGKNN